LRCAKYKKVKKTKYKRYEHKLYAVTVKVLVSEGNRFVLQRSLPERSEPVVECRGSCFGGARPPTGAGRHWSAMRSCNRRRYQHRYTNIKGLLGFLGMMRAHSRVHDFLYDSCRIQIAMHCVD